MPYACQSTATLQFRSQAGAEATAHVDGDAQTPDPGTHNQVAETWYASIGGDRVGNSQFASFNVSTSFAGPASSTSVTWDTSKRMLIGAFSTTNNFPHFGSIAECGTYTISDDDEATLLDDIEAFITAKYGIVWA